MSMAIFLNEIYFLYIMLYFLMKSVKPCSNGAGVGREGGIEQYVEMYII